MKERFRLLWDLFLTFCKIGIFTFGGGYAMIGVIEDTCVEKKKWITHDDMMNMTVIAESTPGPIAINCATFVGFQQAGFWGSVVTTVGVVLPSFLIIYCIASFLENFLEYELIAKAFRGIRVGVSLLIFRVGLTMAGKMQKKVMPRVIAACAFTAVLVIHVFSLNVSTIVLMITGALVGILVYACRKKGGKA